MISINTNYMKNRTLSLFLLCGFIGWCMECFFTGICSIASKKDKKLICTTSVWMFPIYGLACIIDPISKRLKGVHWFLRGGVYTIAIFLTEFCTGTILKHFKACPWDYRHSKYNINEVIRLDYAPLWFFVGLFYEYLFRKLDN